MQITLQNIKYESMYRKKNEENQSMSENVRQEQII